MKKVIAKIDKKTGKLTIETQGYTGDECYKATEGLEKSLGLDRACSVPTAEAYVQEQTNQQVGGS